MNLKAVTLIVLISTLLLLRVEAMASIYLKMLSDAALDILDATVKDNQCGNDLRLFMDGLEKTETWALESNANFCLINSPP